MSDTVIVFTDMPESMSKQVSELAQQREISSSAVIREAVRKELQREEIDA